MKKEWFKRVQTFIGTSKEIVILGPLELSEADIDEIKKLSNIPTIGLDGGIGHRTDQSHFLSVGDGDSAGSTCDINFTPDKNYSDLEGLIMLLPSNVTKITSFGLIGGRLDHQLAVIGNFLKLAKTQNTQIEIRGTNLINILPAGSETLNIHGQFTVMAATDCSVTISGDCRYKGDEIPFEAFSARGLSNIGSGVVQTICTEPLAIFFPPEKTKKDNLK